MKIEKITCFCEQKSGWATSAFKTPSGRKPFTQREIKIMIVSSEAFAAMPRHVSLFQRDLNAAAFYDHSLNGAPLPANELHHGCPTGEWCAGVDYVATTIPDGWCPDGMVKTIPPDGILVHGAIVQDIAGISVTIFEE